MEELKPKYQISDRVLPLGGSYIYIVDDCYYDNDINQYMYMVHGLDSPTTIKYFEENKLSFAGFSR